MEDIEKIIEVFRSLDFSTYEWNIYNYDGNLQINGDSMNTYLYNLLKYIEQLEKTLDENTTEHIATVNRLQELEKDFEIVDHECDRLEKRNDELTEENNKLVRVAIETAFDEDNKDTEFLCRRLLEWEK